MGFSKSDAKRELYSNTSLPQEIRESLNDQPNFTPKATRQGRTEKPQSQQKERNHKSQSKNKLKTNEGEYSKDQQN